MSTFTPTLQIVNKDAILDRARGFSRYGRTPSIDALGRETVPAGQTGVKWFEQIPGEEREVTDGSFTSGGYTKTYPGAQVASQNYGIDPIQIAGLGAQYLGSRAGHLAGEAMRADPALGFGDSMIAGAKAVPGDIMGDLSSTVDSVKAFPGKAADFLGLTPDVIPPSVSNPAGLLSTPGTMSLRPLAPMSNLTNAPVVLNPSFSPTPIDPGFAAFDPATAGVDAGSLFTAPVPVGGAATGQAVTSNLGSNVATPELLTIGDTGWSFGDNFLGGGVQSGLFAGGVTLGLGLLQGQDFKTAAKEAVDTGVGTAVGYAVGGPIGGFIGGAVGGVFRVICTELNSQGLLSDKALRYEELYTLRKIHPFVVRGYHVWAFYYVRGMQASSLFSQFTNWWAGARAREILFQCGKREKPDYGGKLARLIVEPACFVVGCAAWALDIEEIDWCGAK